MDNPSDSQLSRGSSISRLFGWFVQHKMALMYVVYLNIGIMAIGLYLMQYGDALSEHPLFAALNDVMPYLVLLRLGLEVWVYLNWRKVIGWLRRTFRLRNRTTWFLLQCQRLFKLMMALDFSLHIILFAGKVSL